MNDGAYSLADYLPVIGLGVIALIVIIGAVMIRVRQERRDSLRRAIYEYTAGRRWRGEPLELRRLVRFRGFGHISCVIVSYDAVGKIIDGTHDEDDVHDRIGSYIVHEKPDGNPEDTGHDWRFHYVPRQ